MQRSNSISVEMRERAPEQKTHKKLQKLANIKKDKELAQKVPVWLDLTYRNQEKPFVIDADRKFLEFREAVKAYLLYYKEHSDKGYYFNLRNQNTKFTLTNSNAQMGELFQKYKTQLGWLQIEVKEQSMF